MPCLFCDYRELLKEIQNSYNPAVQATELEILRPVLEAEVLVLDELGAVKSSNGFGTRSATSSTAAITNKKTTIITTNFLMPSGKAAERKLQAEEIPREKDAGAQPARGDAGRPHYGPHALAAARNVPCAHHEGPRFQDARKPELISPLIHETRYRLTKSMCLRAYCETPVAYFYLKYRYLYLYKYSSSSRCLCNCGYRAISDG